jgi:hypothetical protein
VNRALSWSLASLASLPFALASCTSTAPSATASGPAPSTAAASPPPPAPTPTFLPDIEIVEPGAALVRGTRVAFDGIAEGLAWPALEKALGPRKPGDTVAIRVARAVRIDDLLRAAWTVRTSDVQVQSLDGDGALRAVTLRAKRDSAAPLAGCHLAVFLRPDGSLRVAAPGGPQDIRGEDVSTVLARSLEAARARCSLAYVAFGAESDAAPWGPVFDVVVAVDRAKSAGDARYVLGQAMHASR